MRFSPVRASIERGGAFRTLATASGILGLILSLGGLRILFREPAVILFGLVSFIPFVLYRLAARPKEGVTVEASPEALVVDERRFPMKRFAGAWARGEHTAVVVLDDRTEIAADVAPRRAEEVLEALEWSLVKRTLPTPLRGTLGPFTLGFLVFVTTSIATIWLAGATRALHGYEGWLLLGSFVFAAVVARVFASPYVVLGADGLRVHRGPFRTFVRYADVSRVERAGSGLRVHLASGRTLALPMVAQDGESVAAVEAAIAEGRARAGGAGALATLLARGGRTVERWREDLASLASRSTGFRDLAVTPEALARELEDVSAPKEVRVAAALALETMEPKGPRVASALATCADPDLRDVLASVRDGTVDDERLDALDRR